MNEKLVFITKKNNTSKADVSISLYGKKKMATSIILRNNVDRSISKTSFLVVAVSGDRLYFREATEEEGYKISCTSSKTSKTTSIVDDALNEFALTHAGDYPLQYDKTLKLFYVDTE